jgi:hypothetical protein
MGDELGQVHQAFLAQSPAGRHLEKGLPYLLHLSESRT